MTVAAGIRARARRVALRAGLRAAGLNDRPDFARRLVADDRVRSTAVAAWQRGDRLRRNVDLSDPAGELVRLVRDGDLQDELTAFVHSVSDLLDAGKAVAKRRALRRIGILVLMLAGGALVIAVAARRGSGRRTGA
jgi:hypothetical protein